jgi:DNA-binding CsgD family transcriptional regulator
LRAARRCCEFPDLGFYGWCLGELVEAGVRAGDRAAAEDALVRLTPRAEAGGTDWGLGMLAVARALLAEGGPAEDGRADDGLAEAHYLEAIERLDRAGLRGLHGRALLLYGEWLQQQGRRSDARRQLQAARDQFTRIGAGAFAERAGASLARTGVRVGRQRIGRTGTELTAQEARIAALAGSGLTNPEIGAELFISAHTVDWHLRKVFIKLGINSRRQLADR